MATPLLGTGYGLWIDFTTSTASNDRGTEANYKLVACSTETGMDFNRDETDTSNKCDEGYSSSVPGLANWNFNFNGQAVSLVAGETDKTNYQKLLELAKAGTTFFSKLTSTDDEDYIREGKTYITSFNETQPNQAVITVTATFKGVGELFITPEAP